MLPAIVLLILSKKPDKVKVGHRVFSTVPTSLLPEKNNNTVLLPTVVVLLRFSFCKPNDMAYFGLPTLSLSTSAFSGIAATMDLLRASLPKLTLTSATFASE